LSKLKKGFYDGIVLSEAGLIRLGLQDKISWRFDPSTFYPAPGQGVIALETRKSDNRVRDLCLKAGDGLQRIISLAELSALTSLGFDCRTPFGMFTNISGDMLEMKGFYVDPLTDQFVEKSVSGPMSASVDLGKELSNKLLGRGN
jgi:hydroxymethylbilane synthase